MKIITGMHRSGTSLVANLFFEAGANLGDPNTFYRPDKWNPEGYFEQPDIHAINMPLINGIWWKFAYFNLPSTNTVLRRSKKFETQIRQTAQKYDDCVVKETRYCVTLPAWQQYGTNVEKIIVCLRDPLQVARSIQKRNSTILRHGYYLWYEHNRRILQHAQDIPIWFIYYQNVLDSTQYNKEMDAAFRFFDMELTATKLEELRDKLVKVNMNHNPETTTQYPPKIAALWDELRQKHAKQFEE